MLVFPYVVFIRNLLFLILFFGTLQMLLALERIEQEEEPTYEVIRIDPVYRRLFESSFKLTLFVFRCCSLFLPVFAATTRSGN